MVRVRRGARSIVELLVTSLFVAGCVSLTIAGCKDDPPASARPAPGPASAPEAARAKPPPPSKGFSQEDVDALLERWLQAQNQGDFAAYEQLYARRMTGTKRVGTRATTMDRSAWMADRSRMFRKPISVTAGDRSFRARGANALVEFTQQWSQGTFTDRGRKRLIVVQEDGALRIVNEDMLNSEVAEDGRRLAETFLPVVRIDERAYVLLRQSAEPAWGSGPFTKTNTEAVDVVFLQRADANLPAEANAWRGRALTVHGLDGATCDATIVELHLYAGALGSFQTDADNAGTIDVQAVGRQALQKQRPSLIGRLGGCDGSFALPKPLVPAAVYAQQPLDAALERRAVTATEALPYYLDRQREYIALLERPGISQAQAEAEARAKPWPEGHRVYGFGGPDGKRFVAVSIGASGCGTLIAADMLAIYEVASDGELRLLNDRVERNDLLPTLLLDVDGDGKLELTSGKNDGLWQGLYTIRLGGIVQLAWVPYFLGICGC